MSENEQQSPINLEINDKLQGTVVVWMSANRLMLNVDKTEWLLVGSRRTLSSLDITRPVLQLGGNIVAAPDHVRLLGVDIVSDLSLDRHVNYVSASCFYRLRQM